MTPFQSKFVFYSGLFFILIGFLVNETLITYLFSYDDTLSRNDIRFSLFFFQAVCLIFGTVFLFKRTNERSYRFLQKFWLLSFSIIFSFVLAEITVRFIRPTPAGFPSGTLLFEPDSVLGWHFLANTQTTVTWGNEAQTQVTINQNGFRSRHLLSDDSIWLMGDSFVSALEVEQNKRFSDLLQKDLKEEVVNLGVNGYGPVQYGLLTEQLLSRHRPKLIVYLLYLRNDLYDSSGLFDWMHGMKRPLIKNDTLVYPENTLNEEVMLNQKRYLNRNKIRPEDSHLYNLIQQFFHQPQDFRYRPPELDLSNRILSDTLALSLQSTKIALKRIQEIHQRENIPFAFILAPSIVQVEPDFWTQYLAENKLHSDDYDLQLPQRYLTHWLDSLQIPFLDLQNDLRQLQTQSKKPFYFRLNQHWTAEGHRVVAQLISPWLHEKALLSD